MKHGTAKTLRVGCILLFIFLFCAFALLPQSVRGEKVTATVTGGNAPFGVAISPDGAYAYVANSYSGTVSVISTATNTVTKTVNVGGYPSGVAVTPNGQYVYVTNAGAGGDFVAVISTATNTVTTTVNIGAAGSACVAITPDGAYAYVTNENSGTVSVISTTTNTVTTTITGITEPFCVAVSPDGAYAYVASEGNFVAVISTTTNTVTTKVTLPNGSLPWGVAVSPDGAYAYVTNEGSNSLSVISTATNMVTATVTGLNYPYGVAVTPNGEYAYVANNGISPNYVGSVSVISTASALVAPTVTPTPAAVDKGQTSALTSTAVSTGTSPYTYMWIAKAPGGSLVAVGSNSASFSFVTDSSTATGVWNFWLAVYDSTGASVAPISTTVTVNAAPTVSIAPAGSLSLDVGQSKTFTATASGGSGSISYQWYLDGAAVGSNSAGYSYAAAAGSHSVTCMVTDSASTPVTSPASNAVSIAVSASPTVSVAPVGPLTLTVGQVQAFTATPSGGSGTISYQWYLDGTAVGSNSASYSYTAGGTSHSVTCSVTDSASTPVTSPSSNAVSVTVNPASTPTPTPAPTQTPTPAPTLTPTSTPTSTPTPTPVPTATPTPTTPSSAPTQATSIVPAIYGAAAAVAALAIAAAILYQLKISILQKLKHIFKIRKSSKRSAVPPRGGVSVPSGVNITVHPHPNVLLTFGQVTQAGGANATPLTSYPPLPQGGSFIAGTVFDIKTSAAFTGKVTVGIHFDGAGLTDAQKLALKVFRIDSAKGSVWEDVTLYIDPKNNIAYGAADHFSIFGVR